MNLMRFPTGLAFTFACVLCAAPPEPRIVKVAGEQTKLLLWSDGSVAVSAGAGLARVALPGKAIDIAANTSAYFTVLEDGAVLTWTGAPAAPRAVAGLGPAVQVVATGAAALALLRDGTVRAWGARTDGLLGDGRHPKRYGENGDPAPTPVLVPGLANIRQLSAGTNHILALTNDGRVYSWGSNYHGALGRPPRRELPMDEPAEVTALRDVAAIAGGQGISTVLKQDGTVWVWGANWHGQFGNGERTDPPGVGYGYELTPQRVPGIANVAAISVGRTGRHTLVLLNDGTLRGWGNTDWGQLGAGVSGDFQLRPVTPKLTGVQAVFAAGRNSFAVLRDGSLQAWGAGAPRQWPLDANTKFPKPVAAYTGNVP